MVYFCLRAPRAATRPPKITLKIRPQKNTQGKKTSNKQNRQEHLEKDFGQVPTGRRFPTQITPTSSFFRTKSGLIYVWARSTARGSGLNVSEIRLGPFSQAHSFRTRTAVQNPRYVLSIRKSRRVQRAALRRYSNEAPKVKGQPHPAIRGTSLAKAVYITIINGILLIDRSINNILIMLY